MSNSLISLSEFLWRSARRAVVAKFSVVAALVALALAMAAPKADAEEIIQLAPLLVHAQIEGTSTVRQLPISVRLEVSTTKRADYVCAVYPRLRDAVVRYLNSRRFPVTRNGQLEIKGIDTQLRPVMTQAIDWDILDKIHVIQGSFDLPSVIAARLIQNGCLRIENRAAHNQDGAAAKSEH